MWLVAIATCKPTVQIRGRFCGNHELLFNIHGKIRHIGARRLKSRIHSSQSERLPPPDAEDGRVIMPGTCSTMKKKLCFQP